MLVMDIKPSLRPSHMSHHCYCCLPSDPVQTQKHFLSGVNVLQRSLAPKVLNDNPPVTREQRGNVLLCCVDGEL